MASIFAVAEHFCISPAEILMDWSFPLFLDSLERLAVLDEVETRKANAMESQR